MGDYQSEVRMSQQERSFDNSVGGDKRPSSMRSSSAMLVNSRIKAANRKMGGHFQSSSLSQTSKLGQQVQ